MIRGYAAVVDQTQYGLPLTAFLRVRLQSHGRDVVRAFEERVRELDEVLECVLLTGDADYLLRVVVADLASYEAFIRTRMHAIAGIAALDTSFAYGTVKTGLALPEPP